MPEGAEKTAPSTASRPEVKAETKAAVKAGEIPRGESNTTKQ
jgi:hypothetical protein